MICIDYENESTILNMEKPQFKTIPCTKCQGDMPELRLTEYGYNFCIKCSESGNYVKPKQGINVLMGEGDHTWVKPSLWMLKNMISIYLIQVNLWGKILHLLN